MSTENPDSNSDTAPSGPDLIGPFAADNGWGRLRLSTLVALRWRGLVGQIAVLIVAGPGLGLQLPWIWLVPLVAVSVAVNLALTVAGRGQRALPVWTNALVLGFDTAQLAMLLFLTGGVTNPFAVLMVAPIALAASALRTEYVLALVFAALACVLGLALWARPLPPPLDQTVQIPPLMRAGLTVALEAAIVFTASYAWRASKESEQMELALNVTQQVLAREQKLSALGALAAAAAHELGTPLATIQIVSREIARGAKADDPLREDAELLIEQAGRCREILQRLTAAPEAPDALHDRLALRQFLNELVESHQGGEIRVEAVVSGPPGEAAPEVRRLPEVLHAMSTLIDNAADFARGEVLVRARYDSHAIIIEVHDDGPGFSPEVLGRLGAPYVTTRPAGTGEGPGYVGMGLGFFIAKTLLERTGATVSHHNARRGGAVVAARWPREALEAPALREFSA